MLTRPGANQILGVRMASISHRWNFFRAGGSVQVNIVSGGDIKDIDSLDPKLWSALSCPTSGLSFDEATLKLIDSDGDGRIRREEIIEACQWTCSHLKDADILLLSSPELPLSAIDEGADGAVMLKSAKKILENLGKPQAQSISVADFADESKIFADTPFNADGVITELSCGNDDDLKSVFADVLACSVPKRDRSGRDGIDAEAVNVFFDSAQALSRWEETPGQDPSIMHLGEKTTEAFEALKGLRQKIDEWFERADILKFDPDACGQIRAQTSEKIVAAYSTMDAESIKALPLFALNGESIDFSSTPNPQWAGQIQNFKKNVLEADGLSQTLTRSDWLRLQSSYAPYEQWINSKPQNNLGALDRGRLSAISSDENRNKLLSLIEKDESVRQEVENIAAVEKLVRYNANLYMLLKNFVSFQSFYTRGLKGIFQFGRLFIDRRMCSLCVKVDDVAKHSAMAALGGGYLVYCKCSRKGQPDITIAAMVTAGDSDNLIVGRNGIFYDNSGAEWDATIIKIVDNPIGLGQAFLSPYKRIARWVGQQISKQAADSDKSVVSDVATANIVKTAAPDKKKIDVGTVAALGVAVGGVTTAFGMVLEAVFGLGYWLPLGVLGIVLAISLPSVLMAWMKLRMRNLAPLLDGNGWAVNCDAKINAAFGAQLTKLAKIPVSAHFSKKDDFPSKSIINKKTCAAAAAAIALFAAICLKCCDTTAQWQQAAPMGAEAKKAEKAKPALKLPHAKNTVDAAKQPKAR